MRPDLTQYCKTCRVRLPARRTHCPLCAKKLKGLPAGGLRRERPAPMFPFLLLGYALALIGVLATLAAPAATIGFGILGFYEPEFPGALVGIGMAPFMVMSLAFACSIMVALFGGVVAVGLMLVFWILRPPVCAGVVPFVGEVPRVPPSNFVVAGLEKLDAMFSKHRSDTRIKTIGWCLAIGGGLVCSVVTALAEGPDFCLLLFMGAFFGGLFGGGWAAWLYMVLHGPQWLLGSLAPGDADRRRKMIGTRDALIEELTRDRIRYVGVIRAAVGELVESPDGSGPSLGWHVRGTAAGHDVDDAAVAPFNLEREGGGAMVVQAGTFTLVDLDPDEPGEVSAAFLTARGLCDPKVFRGELSRRAQERSDEHRRPRGRLLDVSVRKLAKGDRVAVFGELTRAMNPEGGYRGGEIDALRGTAEAPIVVLRLPS